MTCEDCSHYDVCGFNEYKDFNEICSFFKDKSRIIELPCKVGSDFYVLTINYDYCFKCEHFYEDYCEKGFKLFPDFDDFGKDRFCKKHRSWKMK